MRDRRIFVLLFAVTLNDRRLARADKPKWSLREFVGTFYVNPRKNHDFSWAFASRFMFILAYAFLVTYQAYYLLDKIGTAKADVPQQIFLGTLTQSAFIVAASLIGGKLSDRTRGSGAYLVMVTDLVRRVGLMVCFCLMCGVPAWLGAGLLVGRRCRIARIPGSPAVSVSLAVVSLSAQQAQVLGCCCRIFAGWRWTGPRSARAW